LRLIAGFRRDVIRTLEFAAVLPVGDNCVGNESEPDDQSSCPEAQTQSVLIAWVAGGHGCEDRRNGSGSGSGSEAACALQKAVGLGAIHWGAMLRQPAVPHPSFRAGAMEKRTEKG
jgi:hypothetical protein